MVDDPDLYAIHVAAGRLGCSENHVYGLIARGLLPTVDISTPGSKRSKARIRREDLAAYIESLSGTA